MMQVSTLYAHSLERQLVARRSQNIIKNLSRSRNSKTNKEPTTAAAGQQPRKESSSKGDFFPDDSCEVTAGLMSLTALERSVSCPAGAGGFVGPPPIVYSSLMDFALIDSGGSLDSKEFSDRLCKLPTNQCGRSGHILGSPRKQSGTTATSAAAATRPSPSPPSAMKLSRSAGHLGSVAAASSLSPSPHAILVKSQSVVRRSSLDMSSRLNSKTVMDSALLNLTINDKKSLHKSKCKAKKDVKRIPSNFMYLGTWTTKQHCDRLLEQVRSGDVLEFNIKFHHHWGIAVLPNKKRPTLNNLELIHLERDADNRQRVVKEPLGRYWVEGVTARINNSRDVHKPPSSATEVVTTSLKLTSQPYREWQNSEQLIAYCRYAEKARIRHMSDAARWGSLSKCVGLWMNMVSSRHSSPTNSPAVGRKRFLSVNF